MSALTSIRTRLTENPQGLTRDEIYSKVHFETPKDIALALNQLKQADQIVEHDGRYFLKEMLGQGATVPPKTSHTPAAKVLQPQAEKKAESFPIDKTHISTAAQVSNYLLDEFKKDPERWIPNTEIMRVCSDGTKQGNQRVSVALSSMKAQGKIVPKEGERGFYRWKKPVISAGQVFVPMVDELKEETPPAVEVPAPALELREKQKEEAAAPEEPEKPSILFSPLLIPPQFLTHLRQQETEATNDFIAKCQWMIKTWSEEDRVACAQAAGRMEALQAMVEKYEELEKV
jgi:hypothetical protein